MVTPAIVAERAVGSSAQHSSSAPGAGSNAVDRKWCTEHHGQSMKVRNVVVPMGPGTRESKSTAHGDAVTTTASTRF